MNDGCAQGFNDKNERVGTLAHAWIHIHLTSNVGFLALETLQMLKGGMQIYLSKLLNVRISKTN